MKKRWYVIYDDTHELHPEYKYVATSHQYALLEYGLLFAIGVRMIHVFQMLFSESKNSSEPSLHKRIAHYLHTMLGIGYYKDQNSCTQENLLVTKK